MLRWHRQTGAKGEILSGTWTEYFGSFVLSCLLIALASTSTALGSTFLNPQPEDSTTLLARSGHLDLAVTNRTGGTVSLLVGNGTGAFTLATTVSVVREGGVCK